MLLYLTKNDKEFPKGLNITDFTPQEFNTGKADVFCMDTSLLTFFQWLRTFLGVQIVINSGYRSVAYNKKVGGVEGSRHCYGQAIDFTLNSEGRARYNIIKVASIIEDTLFYRNHGWGIEIDLHPDSQNGWGYIHIDCRKDKWRALRFSGSSYITCNSLFGVIDISNKASVYAWQYLLNMINSAGLKIDGIYGAKTRKAIEDISLLNAVPRLIFYGLML